MLLKQLEDKDRLLLIPTCKKVTPGQQVTNTEKPPIAEPVMVMTPAPVGRSTKVAQ
jgi:hypothetical protein